MKSAIAWALFLPAIPAFAAEPVASPHPPWLDQKIAEFEKLPPFKPPRSILRVKYKGQGAYYVTPACCDIPSELYDEGGALLCYPEGGFAGGDGKCPSFTLIDNVAGSVWRDERRGGAAGKGSAAK